MKIFNGRIFDLIGAEWFKYWIKAGHGKATTWNSMEDKSSERNCTVLRSHIIEPWELRSENEKWRMQLYQQEF